VTLWGQLVWEEKCVLSCANGGPGGSRTPDPRIRSLSRTVRAGPPGGYFVLVRPDIDDEIAAFVLACAGLCGYLSVDVWVSERLTGGGGRLLAGRARNMRQLTAIDPRDSTGIVGRRRLCGQSATELPT